MPGLFSTPKAPEINVPAAPPQEDTSAQIDKQAEQKRLSLERYLIRASGLGANELRGSTQGTGLRP